MNEENKAAAPEVELPNQQQTNAPEMPSQIEGDATTALDSDARLRDLEVRNNELNDKYLRLYSEFDNYRRRTAKERLDQMKTAGEDVYKLLLPILDDFDRAMSSMETATEVASVKEGVVLIHQKLSKELLARGLKPFDPKGELFDPELHEAVTQFPASPEMKGKVVDVVEMGYTLNEKVVRFAKVVVGA